MIIPKKNCSFTMAKRALKDIVHVSEPNHNK